MKLINITRAKVDIQIYVKNTDFTDVLVNVPYNHFVYIPTVDITKSITMHGVKKNLFIVEEMKPAYLQFFEIYNEETIIELKNNYVEEPMVQLETEVIEAYQGVDNEIVDNFIEINASSKFTQIDEFETLQKEVEQKIIDYTDLVALHNNSKSKKRK